MLPSVIQVLQTRDYLVNLLPAAVLCRHFPLPNCLFKNKADENRFRSGYDTGVTSDKPH